MRDALVHRWSDTGRLGVAGNIRMAPIDDYETARNKSQMMTPTLFSRELLNFAAVTHGENSVRHLCGISLAMYRLLT